jgi:hypothetical protein
MKRPIGLSIYLAVMVAAQVALYLAGSRVGSYSAFYFDPRMGIHAFSEWWGGGTWPTIPGWVSAGWLGAVVLALLLKKVTLRFYLLSEAILSVPSVAFFILVLFVNVSPAHGFSIGELLIPVPVFAVFSVIPFVWAVVLMRRSRIPGRDAVITTGNAGEVTGAL